MSKCCKTAWTSHFYIPCSIFDIQFVKVEPQVLNIGYMILQI